MVTTPDGMPVAMVHCNNRTSGSECLGKSSGRMCRELWRKSR